MRDEKRLHVACVTEADDRQNAIIYLFSFYLFIYLFSYLVIQLFIHGFSKGYTCLLYDSLGATCEICMSPPA